MLGLMVLIMLVDSWLSMVGSGVGYRVFMKWRFEWYSLVVMVCISILFGLGLLMVTSMMTSFFGVVFSMVACMIFFYLFAGVGLVPCFLLYGIVLL